MIKKFDKYINEGIRNKMTPVNSSDVMNKLLNSGLDIEKVIYKLWENGLLIKLSTEDGKTLYDLVSQDKNLRSREEFGKFLSFMSYYGSGVVIVNKETYKFFIVDNQSMNAGYTLIRALKILM